MCAEKEGQRWLCAGDGIVRVDHLLGTMGFEGVNSGSCSTHLLDGHLII
jgi:hypothetical protein